jgi:hypothetical protein
MIFISAVIFSLLHLRRSVLSAMQAFILGIFFAHAFVCKLEKTNSQKYAYAAACLSHMIHNFAGTLLDYVPASYLVGWMD